MAGNEADGVLSIEQVLVAEADEIFGTNWRKDLKDTPRQQDAQDERSLLNADDREPPRPGDKRPVLDDVEVNRRKALYRALNKLNRAALCCSGGGIRSATFCLGVIQALAGHDVSPKRPGDKGKDEEQKKSVELTRETFISTTLEDKTGVVLEVQERRLEHAHAAPSVLQRPDAGLSKSFVVHSDPSADISKRTSQQESVSDKAKIDPENSLLGRFHFLSTVSGGGYIGSWLSAWRERDGFEAVVRGLTDRAKGPDVEPPEISWLRAYSNYLTPRIGIASADTWADIAIIVRNLILNWLIIVPVVCLALIALKLIATASVWAAYDDQAGCLVTAILLLGIFCLVVAQGFTTHHRPPRRPLLPGPNSTKSVADPVKQAGNDGKAEAESVKDPQKQPGNTSEKAFLWGDLIWAVFSAIAVTIFFASEYFSSQHEKWVDSVFTWLGATDWLNSLGVSASVEFLALTAFTGLTIYAIGWIVGWIFGRIFEYRPRKNFQDLLGSLWDFIAWAVSGLIYGALIGLGAILFMQLHPYPANDENRICLLLPVILGVPWVLMSQLTADDIFGGLVSYGRDSDADREWLGRAAGWSAAFAIAWAIVAFLVFVGGDFVQTATGWGEHAVTAAGGVMGVISGIATALIGKSSATPARSDSDDQAGLAAMASNVALAVAGPIFVAVLIIALSVGLDQLLLSGSLVAELQLAFGTHFDFYNILFWLGIGFGVALITALLSSYFVNINRFSLHAVYRNRLIRAYLGASRDRRHPDKFTGFDDDDNLRMHDLWPPASKAEGQKKPRILFHIINITLNVVSTKRLAWQERKAESFTVSPLHSGSAYLGFRPSREYGDSRSKKTESHGITLGTAMAISGAAVSPNMGYHSSPSISLLLTLFNVRLGWWLGNPGKAGGEAWIPGNEPYRREGPRFSALPLLFEALGQTTDDRPYVYLSDGGHFEDLGLYEMVRRRCRFIVVVDADGDPDFAFEDLGNAVRKIYIDLGVRIKFENLDKLKNRPSAKAIRRAKAESIPYHAIGTIDYKSADGTELGCKNGLVLYIKHAYHGTIEGAGVRSYAIANPTFPHETTVDQWFTESQFESYRSLAMDIVKDILHQPGVREDFHEFLTS